jgi:hypothetical protein
VGDFTDNDYEAIEAAVMETARGRWFLSEHARRNRAADTVALLGAIKKLERIIAGASKPAGEAEILADLARLSKAAANAMALLGHMKERIDALIGARGGGAAEPQPKPDDGEPPLPGIISSEEAKRRIVVVRHGRSEETRIPLAEEPGDPPQRPHPSTPDRSPGQANSR